MRATDAIRSSTSTVFRITNWLRDRSLEILTFDNVWSDRQDPPRSLRDTARTEGTSAQTDAADERCLQAVNVTKDTLVASRVSLAITSHERRRGLLDRQQMDSDEGLYIVPTQWIHMFGMRFPIDVAFLSSSGRVLWVHHGIKPYRLSRLVWRAEGALELPAGTLRASHTEVGDTIELRASTSETESRRVF
jgi:uncharacterized membrane protein (UPF0127 family)